MKSGLPAHAARTVLLVARDEILTRTLRLPSTHPKEINNLVAYRLPQELPYAIAEIVYHADTLQVNPDGYAQVGVLWTLRKNMESKLASLKEFGIEIDEAIPSTQGLLFYFLRLRAADPTLPSRVFLAALAAKQSELALVDGEKVLFSRSAKHGIEHVFHEKDAFVQECKNFLQAAEKEGWVKPEALCVLGPAEEREAAMPVFSGITDLPIHWPQDLAGVELPVQGADFAARVGASSGPWESPASLLPTEIREERDLGKKARLARHGLLLSACFMIFSLGGLALDLTAKERRRDALLSEAGNLSPQTKEVLAIAEAMKLRETLAAHA